MKLGITALGRRVARAARRRRPGIAILMYHRVAEPPADPYGLAVAPEAFAEQMEVLARVGPVLSLASAREAIERGRVPARAFVVTFDDGYRDNLTVAEPILRRLGLPATVFVTTAAVGATEELWWDLLERAILGAEELPDRLEVKTPKALHSFDFTACRIYGDADRRRDRAVRAWEAAEGSRARTYHELCRVVQPLTPERQRGVALAVCAWAGASASGVRATSETMTRTEVARLARDGLVEIGGHTTTHLELPAHSPELQREDIAANRAFLEETIDRPIVSFAYPYGAYGAETPAITREIGFLQACSTVEVTARPGADSFLLPRFAVPSLGAEPFERWLGDRFAT
jgi:peptidoglycan/xylan/chitin deacetylase (PgdA/CDA1 family)